MKTGVLCPAEGPEAEKMDADSDSQQADKVRPSALTFQNICLNFTNIDPFITQSILFSAKEVIEQISE